MFLKTNLRAIYKTLTFTRTKKRTLNLTNSSLFAKNTVLIHCSPNLFINILRKRDGSSNQFRRLAVSWYYLLSRHASRKTPTNSSNTVVFFTNASGLSEKERKSPARASLKNKHKGLSTYANPTIIMTTATILTRF